MTLTRGTIDAPVAIWREKGMVRFQVKSFPPLKGRPARAHGKEIRHDFSFIHFSCRLRCSMYLSYAALPMSMVYVAFHLLQQLQHQYQQLLQQV